ncbi:hypothetical protein TRIUR3_27635 [Triticum urartu]|uniref:Uncharacterized protein n=1 Tax=Triticum urartu TaxID=4572 RepID=M7ZCG1_TRIUA|nr:hypothetical protein TRIUR3_27635 [Triticum urartu]
MLLLVLVGIVLQLSSVMPAAAAGRMLAEDVLKCEAALLKCGAGFEFKEDPSICGGGECVVTNVVKCDTGCKFKKDNPPTGGGKCVAVGTTIRT